MKCLRIKVRVYFEHHALVIHFLQDNCTVVGLSIKRLWSKTVELQDSSLAVAQWCSSKQNEDSIRTKEDTWGFLKR